MASYRRRSDNPQYRKKLSQCKLGTKNPQYGKPGHMLGRKHKPETVQLLREKSNAYWSNSELREIWRRRQLGKHIPEEVRKKISEANKGKPKKPHTRATREKLRKISLNLWKNPIFILKIIKSHVKKPTKSENKLISIIEKYHIPLKYTGDGKLLIGKCCPDFIDSRGPKKVVELFGEWWHSKKRIEKLHNRSKGLLTEKGRRSYFKKHGWDLLVIWEHELEDELYIVDKLNSFLGLKSG
jgi:G:T-mismatch repair DNA endonuclease (very short patch repair protein)